jgi:DUF218 domain
VIVLLGVVAGVPAIRDSILRSVGRALVIDEPVGPADAIVLPQWAGGAGAIDAADLVHSGIASRVFVLAEPPKPAEAELTRRGVSFMDETADLIQLLQRLGVAEIERIPRPAGGTEEEAEVLASWLDERRLGSVVIVSSPEHSRRTRRVLHRAFAGHSTKAMIRSARYSAFTPDNWWRTRENIRSWIVELQKLLLDIARHPFS